MNTTEASAGVARVISTARRVCFFAHHDVDNIVDPYVLHYLNSLRAADFTTVLVTTSALSEAEIAKLGGLCADVIVRDNIGLDFGGWADCLASYPKLSAEYLLLCNDSVYGPFWSLKTFIDELTATPADIYGTVLSVGPPFQPHLQSWFLLLRPSAYESAAFRRLTAHVPASLSKQEIIEGYELRFTGEMERAGLRVHAAFDPRRHGDLTAREPFNAAWVLWRELLERRIVPFLKISLPRDRPIWVCGLQNWLEVAQRIDPKLAELCQRNLERRLRAKKPVRWGKARELAYTLTNHAAHTPYAKPLLVADMDAHGSRSGRRGWLPAVTRFAIYNALFSIFRVPYKRVYDAGSRWRRGVS